MNKLGSITALQRYFSLSPTPQPQNCHSLHIWMDHFWLKITPFFCLPLLNNHHLHTERKKKHVPLKKKSFYLWSNPSHSLFHIIILKINYTTFYNYPLHYIVLISLLCTPKQRKQMHETTQFRLSKNWI